jgi:hypothetical protein
MIDLCCRATANWVSESLLLYHALLATWTSRKLQTLCPMGGVLALTGAPTIYCLQFRNSASFFFTLLAINKAHRNPTNESCSYRLLSVPPSLAIWELQSFQKCGVHCRTSRRVEASHSSMADSQGGPSRVFAEARKHQCESER